jgi:uncharacterized protein (TIGR02588 family)
MNTGEIVGLVFGIILLILLILLGWYFWNRYKNNSNRITETGFEVSESQYQQQYHDQFVANHANQISKTAKQEQELQEFSIQNEPPITYEKVWTEA